MIDSQLITLDRRIPFVDAVLSVHDSNAPLENAAHLFAEIEHKHGLRITSDYIAAEEIEVSDDWCRNMLFPFLTETHLVITGGDLLIPCTIYNDFGQEVSFSWREWGGWMAEWANKFWFPRPVGLGTTRWTRQKRDWNYLDFYNRDYLNYQIENYDIWADTVVQVIKKKIEIQKRT
jgi:hypothetical protein